MKLRRRLAPWPDLGLYVFKNAVVSASAAAAFEQRLRDAQTVGELAAKMNRNGTIFVNLGDKYHKGVLQQLPARLAIALADGGLIAKSDLIWHKRRIMPQSAKNRFTCSHEFIYMFTRRISGFTFNHEAVMEDALWKNDPRAGKGTFRYKESRGGGHTAPVVIGDKRLCRSVWEMQTSQMDKGHSATFPAALPLRCIMAGSNEGDTVLDPFNGTGTTGVAALSVRRRYIGVDTNADYLAAVEERLSAAG